MISLKELVNANIKNRAAFTQLSTKLNRLEREKQNELRMANNEIKRFRARYSKSNFRDSAEASDVKMYDTHFPGFCFKRSGEHKGEQLREIIPEIDFECLHFLLFTSGEVDIEKLLCLHLLSTHETEHLTPPYRPRSRRGSPLEQLIERSKDNTVEALEDLPTYVLDVARDDSKKSLLDKRLSARLLINEKILEIIMTVLSALEHSNPDKVQQLISLARDTSSLKKIFKKQHIQEFIATLKNHSLINSSFILTQPLQCTPSRLSIRTPGGALEELVSHIRANVLQFPKREDWITETESKELCVIEQTPLPSKSSKISNSTLRRVKKREDPKEIPTDWKFRRKGTNFIQKNIEDIPRFSRVFNEEEDLFLPKVRRSSSTSRRKSVGETKKKLSEDRSRKSTESSPREQSEIKVHLKQTKCLACMQKWKVPLPEPKVPKRTSRLDSFFVLRVPDNESSGIRKLQTMIEQEQFKLRSYDRRYSNASTSSVSSKKEKRINEGSLNLVALNILDLEKIRLEIREKETKKKLENFLTA